MIKKIKLKNFKCFKNNEIEFKKINILTGVNSSGKSTILQALNLFSITDKEEINLIVKNKWDFVGYKELLNNDSDTENFSISVNDCEKEYNEFFYKSNIKNNLSKVKFINENNDSQE